MRKIVFIILISMLFISCGLSIFNKSKDEKLLEDIYQIDETELESRVYNIELERLIGEFHRKAFQENKDIAELMDKSINLLSNAILVEKININKINNSIKLLNENQVGKVAILDSDKDIDEIYAEAEADFSEAVAEYQNEEFWNSSYRFSQITSLYPVTYQKIDDAFYYMGDSYYKLGLFSSAKESFEHLIKEIPISEFFERSYLMLFRIYYISSLYEDILYLYQDFTDRFPESDSLDVAQYYRGLAYFDLNNFSKAEMAFAEIDTVSNLFFLKSYFTGLSMFLQQNPQEAIFYLENIPQQADEKLIDPNLRTEVLLTASQIATQIDSLDHSRTLLNQIISGTNNHKRDEVLFTLGETYFIEKKFQEAEKSFTDIINQYPESEYAFKSFFKLTYIADKNNNLQKTEEYHDKIMERLNTHKYSGNTYQELNAKKDNREQEIVVLNNKKLIYDILVYEKFKFIHFNDYYKDKYKDEEYVNNYISNIKNNYAQIEDKIEIFVTEVNELDNYLNMLKSVEEVEFQNAIINYRKLSSNY